MGSHTGEVPSIHTIAIYHSKHVLPPKTGNTSLTSSLSSTLSVSSLAHHKEWQSSQSLPLGPEADIFGDPLRIRSDPPNKSCRQHLKPELVDFKSLQWPFVYHLVASMNNSYHLHSKANLCRVVHAHVTSASKQPRVSVFTIHSSQFSHWAPGICQSTQKPLGYWVTDFFSYGYWGFELRSLCLHRKHSYSSDLGWRECFCWWCLWLFLPIETWPWVPGKRPTF